MPRTAAGLILQVVAAVEDKIMDEFSKKFGIVAFPILIIILKIIMAAYTHCNSFDDPVIQNDFQVINKL
ncbi:MAG: hypothetical protein ACQEWG_03080 [Bacteroidota bacterium]